MTGLIWTTCLSPCLAVDKLMNCERLKIVFAGTPEFAAVALKALLSSSHDVVGVLTQPDRPAGRGRKLTSSAVKLMAQEASVPVLQPESLKTEEALKEFKALNADVLVVAAYGLILPKAVLETPPLGCLNIHGSLLPRWRGAAPIHRAILAGDTETGVCIMQMDEGLDTGDVLLKKRTPIGIDESVAQLHDRLATMGAQILLEALPARCNDELQAKVQDNSIATYAEKLFKSEAALDFTLTAAELDRRIRAFNPWPVAEAHLQGKRVRIWQCRIVDSDEHHSAKDCGTIVAVLDDAVRVQAGDTTIDLTVLQWPGKKAQPAAEFLQGHSLQGETFSSVQN